MYILLYTQVAHSYAFLTIVIHGLIPAFHSCNTHCYKNNNVMLITKWLLL